MGYLNNTTLFLYCQPIFATIFLFFKNNCCIFDILVI
nr:MAG TPA: hypothetical protein [Caudoviricetes sp.]